MYKVTRKPTYDEFREMCYEKRRHPWLWKIERYRRYRTEQIMEHGDLHLVREIDKKRAGIIINKAQCRLCGDVIESMSTHDAKTCSCGEITVDGGKEYIRRLWRTDQNNIIELSEFTEEWYKED